jgi:hypothetical protein
MASGDLGQDDHVGVAHRYQWPEAFEDVTVRHLVDTQKEVALRSDIAIPPRFSDPTGAEWIGAAIGEICRLDPESDKAKIIDCLAARMLLLSIHLG